MYKIYHSDNGRHFCTDRKGRAEGSKYLGEDMPRT